MKITIVLLAIWINITAFAQPLFMSITNPQVDGNEVTYDVKSAHFEDVWALSMSISYDSSQMTYSLAKNINLPFQIPTQFIHDIAGYVYFPWIDIAAMGESLPDSSIMFQLVFNMKHGTYGDVCFSDYPLMPFFSTQDSSFYSYVVMDDCHENPFEIILSTAVHDVSSSFDDIIVNSNSTDGTIQFKVEEDLNIGFELISLNGQIVKTFSISRYTKGDNSLALDKVLPQGIYILKYRSGQNKGTAKVMIWY